MINKERILKSFLEHIQIDSPTKYELDYAKVLMKELEDMGFEVKMDDAGKEVGSNSGNVIAKLKGNTEGETILFSAHMDTVSPGKGIKPEIRDGFIYSDETTILAADDKAGIVAVLEGIKTIQENNIPHGDIEIAFSIFEEGGLYGVKGIDYDEFSAETVFVLDSGGSPGEIIIGGPAQNKMEFKFIGKTAHAGVAPETGISAIQMASEAISNMNLLRIDEETTANIGIINGGEATNIVTETVNVVAEARSLDNDKLQEQTDHMVECCQLAAEKFGGKVEIDIENVYGAFSIEEDAEIVKSVKEACEELGLEAYTDTSGGGSDTNIWNQHGFTAVNLGVGMKNPHTVEEYIAIEDLENAGRLVVEIIKSYA